RARARRDCFLLIPHDAPRTCRDLLKIGPARRHEPASTHAGHCLERQPVGRGRLRDAAGWTERASTERGGERLERGDSARGHGRKKFETAQAHIQPTHHVSSRSDTREEGNSGCDRCLAQRFGEPGRDNEARAGFEARFQIGFVQDGTGPGNRPVHFRHLPDRIERDRRTQRYLQRAQTTGDQRFGDRAGISDILDHEHRDDRRKLHDAANIVHRRCPSAKAAAAPNRPGWGWVITLTGTEAILDSKRPFAANRPANAELGNRWASRKPSPPAMTTALAPCASAMSPAKLPRARQNRSSAATARLSAPVSAAVQSDLSSPGSTAWPSIAANPS